MQSPYRSVRVSPCVPLCHPPYIFFSFQPPLPQRGRGTAQAVVGVLWTIHPFLSCERHTRHKRSYRRCAPLPPSQRKEANKDASHRPPRRGTSPPAKCREICSARVSAHHTCGSRPSGTQGMGSARISPARADRDNAHTAAVPCETRSANSSKSP